jgi:hypothetical protein
MRFNDRLISHVLKANVFIPVPNSHRRIVRPDAHVVNVAIAMATMGVAHTLFNYYILFAI